MKNKDVFKDYENKNHAPNLGRRKITFCLHKKYIV